MTIVEFLEARLTEDELTAHAATDASPEWEAHYDYRDVKDFDGHFVVQARQPSSDNHAGRPHRAAQPSSRATGVRSETRDHRRLPPPRRAR